jgi:hypothetical protein
MKRWLLRALYLLGAYAALMLITGLIARSLVTGSSKQTVASALGNRLGVGVSVGAARFDLASWFLLKPAIFLDNVAIGNPAGFRGPDLLTAKRISAQVALLPLLHRRIEMRSILIDTPRIAVETDARDETNIEALIRKLSTPTLPGAGAQPAADPASATALGIDDFRVSSGEVLISGADASQPRVRIGAIDLRLQDLSAGTNCRLAVSGKLFDGRVSGFRVSGHAGPFVSNVLPIDGKLSLTIAPGEIPDRIRREEFGVLLGAPGDKARATLEASIKGDLYNNVSGPAKVTLSGILIGKDANHLMRMDGETPAVFSAQKLMSGPAFHVQVLNARLKLGEGEWAGAASLRMQGQTLSAASRGSIRDVDINTLLGSLTADGGGKIYGVLAIPSYTAQCAGKTADEIRSSLTGTARLTVTKGRIAMLDMLSSIEQALGPAQSASSSASGNTAFSTLTAGLSVAHRRLDLSGIAFDGPGLKFTGSGAIGFDHSMHFDLDTQFTGGIANLVNRLTRQGDTGQAALPVVIAGTVDRPQVRPSVGKLATGAVQGLFQSLFKKSK